MIQRINTTVGSKYWLDLDYYASSSSVLYDKYGVGVTGTTISAGFDKIRLEFLATEDWYYLVHGAPEDPLKIFSMTLKEIPNLITNGTFTTDTAWSKGSGWTISGGRANFTYVASNENIAMLNLLVSGKRYRITYQVVSITGVVQRVGFLGVTQRTSPGIYTEDDINVGGLVGIRGVNAGTTAVIDNIHVYEIPDHSATGNHTVSVSGAEFYSGGANSLRINATAAGYSSNLITNGDFTGGTTGWTLGSGTTYSDNKINVDVTSSTNILSTNFSYTNGKQYLVEIDMTLDPAYHPAAAVLAGVQNDNIWASWVNMGNGKYVSYMTATATGSQQLTIFAANAKGTVDNVLVREVAGEVTLPAASFSTIVPGNKYTIEGWAKATAGTVIYTSDFSASTDWTANEGTVTANIDGVSDGITSYDNTLRFYANAGASNHRIQKTSFLTASKTYALKFKFYIPNSNTNLKGLFIQGNVAFSNINGKVSAGTISGTSSLTLTNVSGKWIEVKAFFKASSTTTALFINGLNEAGSASFTGANSITDDLFYVRDIILEEMPTATIAIGGTSKTVSNISITSTWTKFDLTFEAQGQHYNQPLRLWLNGAGTVHFDKVSLTQAYDLAFMAWIKPEFNGVSQYIYGMNSSNHLTITSANELQFAVSGETAYYTTKLSTGLINSEWNLVGFTLDRTAGVRVFNNLSVSALNTAPITANYGKLLYPNFFRIGANHTGSSRLAAQIGHMTMVRFANLLTSTFNFTDFISGRLKLERLKYGELTGDQSKTPLFLDWTGADTATMLQNKSFTGNNFTSSVITLANDRISR